MTWLLRARQIGPNRVATPKECKNVKSWRGPRTIVKVYASAEERAAAAERSKRRQAGMLKAARRMTPEEIAALPPVKGAERVRARVSDDSETEPEDETFCAPQP